VLDINAVAGWAGLALAVIALPVVYARLTGAAARVRQWWSPPASTYFFETEASPDGRRTLTYVGPLLLRHVTAYVDTTSLPARADDGATLAHGDRIIITGPVADAVVVEFEHRGGWPRIWLPPRLRPYIAGREWFSPAHFRADGARARLARKRVWTQLTTEPALFADQLMRRFDEEYQALGSRGS
jgi:hypothetical protein